MKKKISVKSRLIALMLVCIFLPLVLITLISGYFLTNDRIVNEISKEFQRLKFIDQNVIYNLDEVISKSREATYDGTLIELYEEYRKGILSEQALNTKSFYFLRDHYSHCDEIKMAVCWYREDPRELSCSTYNSSSGACYSCIGKYWGEDHDDILSLSNDLNTEVAFYQSGPNLYLVRNLYTRSYENAATLVLLLNQEYCFQPYESMTEGAAVTVQIDNCTLTVSGKTIDRQQAGLTELSKNGFGYTYEKLGFYGFHNSQRRDYHFMSLVHFPKSTVSALLSGYEFVFIVMVICSVPMLLILLFVYQKNVIDPIQQLMSGAEKLSQGNRGYQICYEPKSKEFSYLTDSFNKMSKKLERQFEQIAKEEIALRDARIKALQLHINPHFMNNTLEIINWEARLSGNEKISKMIEALGILMNAGMDRKNRRMIPLSEEMVYVNAYLYISEERLGSRLTVINELPKEIMGCLVPRLILQPIVENAIEHGVVQRGSGTVTLHGRREGDYLYLEIINEAVLSEQHRAKIAKLLDVNYDASQESSANLGISNVNQRLKMIYGESCGLTIEQEEGERVCARLTMKAEES